MNRGAVESVLALELPKTLALCEPDSVGLVLQFVAAVGDVWSYIGTATQEKLQQYVAQLGGVGAKEGVPAALAIPELMALAVDRIKAISPTAACDIDWPTPNPGDADLYIAALGRAGSYDEADVLFDRLVLPLASTMTEEQVRKLLNTSGNSQVRDRRSYTSGMSRLRSRLTIRQERLDEIVREDDLLWWLPSDWSPSDGSEDA